MMRPLLVLAILAIASGDACAAARLKDVTNVTGIRSNQLLGYGLVVGLKGSGDSLRNAPFTEQSLRSMLERLGVNIRDAGARTKNAAAVMVTAELPPFSRAGGRIDVTVTSLGDATSLAGGMLLMTPLYGGDQQIYAVAQGSIAVSGFESKGNAESLTHGVPTAGRVANGALVERSAPQGLDQASQINLELRNPDFGTAVKVADAINEYSQSRFGGRLARELDMRSVSIKVPAGISTSRFLAEVGELLVEPDMPARVVIDERTGTIVIGRDVRISTVAVTHGNLTVRVTETPVVSQPLPFSDGQTVATSETEVNAVQENGMLSIVRGADLHSLVNGLNRMGLKPPGIIAILQAMKSSGALQAELVVQ
ncbi:MAG: flagellar biosynthesis protein FlgI [Alphaproteobacteria bacterium BRH_c36]|nr:MAG: flagellar biosynthesis protein FlgI [Alphaproteobacteria bacterium BRH_c36]